jgi:hypothetical protein
VLHYSIHSALCFVFRAFIIIIIMFAAKKKNKVYKAVFFFVCLMYAFRQLQLVYEQGVATSDPIERVLETPPPSIGNKVDD